MADIHPNLQYIISGPITANIDSVSIYSARDLPHDLRAVTTEPIVKSGLKDTTCYEVKFVPVPGAEVINVPSDMNMLTFPSKVEVSYLVPMSAYKDDYPLKAYADYRSIKPGANKLGLSLSLIPELYHSVSFSPDSVEYVIEQMHYDHN